MNSRPCKYCCTIWVHMGVASLFVRLAQTLPSTSTIPIGLPWCVVRAECAITKQVISFFLFFPSFFYSLDPPHEL